MTFHINRYSLVGIWALISSAIVATLVALGMPWSLPAIALTIVCVVVPPSVLLMVWEDGLPSTVTDVLASSHSRP